MSDHTQQKLTDHSGTLEKDEEKCSKTQTNGPLNQPYSCATVSGSSYFSGGGNSLFLMGSTVVISFTASSYSFCDTANCFAKSLSHKTTQLL